MCYRSSLLGASCFSPCCDCGLIQVNYFPFALLSVASSNFPPLCAVVCACDVDLGTWQLSPGTVAHRSPAVGSRSGCNPAVE
jgi:hypothetical protein